MPIRRTLVALVVAGLALLGTRTSYGATAIHLPFPAGTAVSILQGYNGGTHQGVERYSLDLTRDDGKTSGSPALAAAPGTVVWSYPPGTGNGCVGIMIDGGDGLHEMLCHLILNHDYANGEHVSAAQVLGTVGPPGTVGNNGVSHIHLQLYRVVGGARTPVPFATPDGAPLEGVSLPGGSAFNQWACSGGSGSGCHIVSQNGAGSPSTSAAATSASATTLTSAASATSGGAALSWPRQQGGGLDVGVAVLVAGTGDCLRVHSGPTTSASTVGCLPDGTQATITDGPRTGDGYTWYKLDELGWTVADYLQPQGSNAVAAPSDSSSPSTPAAAPSTPAQPSAPAQPASPSSTTPQPATQPTPQPPINQSLGLGVTVVVTGTGDCLRVHSGPAAASPVVDCLPDGTSASIADGPVTADGYTWWWLDGRGWVVADYLQPQ